MPMMETPSASGVTMAIAITAATSLGAFWLSRPRREGPPLAKSSFITFFLQLINPAKSVAVLKQIAAEEPPIVRFSTPWFLPEFWVVRDWKALNQVYFGDVATNMEPGDKNQMIYQGIRLITNSIPNMVSKRTDGEGSVHGWSWARKSVAPALSAKNVLLRFEEVQDIVWKSVEEFLSEPGTEKDITKMMSRHTMAMMVCSMMCTTPHDEVTGADFSERFIENVFLASTEFAIRSALNPFRHRMFWDSDVRRAHAAVKENHAFALQLLARHRNDPERNDPKKALSPIAFMDNALSDAQAGCRRAAYASDDEKAADITVFLIASVDTTSFSAVFTISLVYRHPEVLAKLRRELDAANPARGRWSWPMLSSLPYLACVIKESLRARYVVPWHTRELKTGGCVGGYNAAPGTVILGNLFMAGKHGLAEDPEAFIPERHEARAAPHPDAEVLRQHDPFSKGKRQCPGRELADLELKLMLATLFQHLDFEQTSADLECWNQGVMEPRKATFKIAPRADALALNGA